MGDKNTVSVIIYGQEYTFSGEMPREYILKLADKVDATMREMGEGRNQTLSKTAVLSALYIADEYYKAKEAESELLLENHKESETAANYEKLWDEVKQSFASYKQDQQARVEMLERKLEEQRIALESAKEIPEEVKNHITALEEKCKDIESSFFDIQMENIRLKNELSQYRQNR